MTTLAVALLLPELFIKVTILYASCAKCIYALLYLCREITLNGLGLIARTLQLTGRLILQLLLGRHSPRQLCLRARVLDAVLVCTLFLSKSISTTSVDTSVLTVRSWDHSFMSNMILDYIWVTILQSFLSSKALHIKKKYLDIKGRVGWGRVQAQVDSLTSASSDSSFDSGTSSGGGWAQVSM